MKKILIEGLKFIGFSGIGWLIDTTIYLILTSIFKLNVDISNIFSSLVGVTFVFIMSNSKINIKIKYLIYIIYQMLLILTASKIMLILKDYLITSNINIIIKYINIIVKIIITPFTMLINFIVMKLLIEKI